MKRLRIIEALFVAALVLALAVLFSTQAHAAERWYPLDTCYATELDGQHMSADYTPHAKQCRARAAYLLEVAKDSGQTCSFVVMFREFTNDRETSGSVKVEATCRLYDGGNAWYVQINNGKFRPLQ